jgi:hypothetical protein
MALLPAVRYVAATTKSALGAIHLQCHVRPGTSKQRQGIMSISEDFIEVCVAAQARGGEANKAVKELLSRVSVLFIIFHICICAVIESNPSSTTSCLLVLGTQMPKV